MGNHHWKQKKELYQIISEPKKEKINAMLDKLNKKYSKIKITPRTRRLIQDGKCLPFTRPLVTVDDWNKDIIIKRGENLASLAWKEIYPWIQG